MQEMKDKVPAVGKGGVGLPLPPDVLDLPIGVLEPPLLLHRPAHQSNCCVPPAKSNDALLAVKSVRKGASQQAGKQAYKKVSKSSSE